MQRDYVNEKSPYFLQVDIQKEISSYGVEQKMNDYIGLQKTIISILEVEGFFREVINEETGKKETMTQENCNTSQWENLEDRNESTIFTKLIALFKWLSSIFRLLASKLGMGEA